MKIQKTSWCLLIICGLLISQIHAHDYCEVLQKGLMFYKANRAGRLPDDDIPWRGNSVLTDASPGSSPDANGDGNLSGGYFDAGDGVKFGLPMAYSMTMLAWSFIEYESNIETCGLTDLYLETIKYGTDYLIAAHIGENEMVAQVGDGNLDHSYWGPPETMTMERPVFTINAANPGTEIACESAAALAAASIAFKKSNPEYSATCLTHAKQLQSFGDTYRGVYSDVVTNAKTFYNSWSGYKDDLVWGGLWLYRATQDETYLTAAKSNYATFGIGASAQGNSHDWDNKGPGAILLLHQLTGEATYKNDFESWLKYWKPGGGITYTPGGLAWIRQWGPARYAATSAFLSAVYGGTENVAFTKSQIDYMLGDNPNKQSFVVGYGPNSPINPHHRAAHHSTTNDINNPVNNLYLLTGALVGGPGQDDSYVDDRSDYIKNEVATDYNAGFVGALAALVDPTSTSVPTTAPTESPTTTPTEVPTETPTTAPTETPTTAPTETPTTAPTETPTTAPTETPTTAPTETPTTAPTETPTTAPTETPTEAPTTAPTEAPAASLNIYKDGLQSNFQDWSWGEHNLNDVSVIQGGNTKSISFTPKNWGALFFGCNQCIDTDKYKSVEFYINGGQNGGQIVDLSMVKNSAKTGTTKVITVPANTWTKVSATFAELGVNGKCDGLWIQDTKGDQSTLYVDSIRVVA